MYYKLDSSQEDINREITPHMKTLFDEKNYVTLFSCPCLKTCNVLFFTLIYLVTLQSNLHGENALIKMELDANLVNNEKETLYWNSIRNRSFECPSSSLNSSESSLRQRNILGPDDGEIKIHHKLSIVHLIVIGSGRHKSAWLVSFSRGHLHALYLTSMEIRNHSKQMQSISSMNISIESDTKRL
ncbi:unnamed protein product [Lepeophtheirus salmonis]|nr:unnamed protein product [Lepeophtheirus salmonis]CAF2957049.1 unnamed protein product [Lepeophtheirus salmonis]